MSTPPKRDAKAAAKRRADARRRNRDIGRHLFAYGVIAILVIGTVATVLVPTVGTTTVQAPTIAAPTQDKSGIEQLLTQADQEVVAGNWITATGLYKAYLGQNPNRPDVYLKLGKALLGGPSPSYTDAASYLQQVVNTASQDAVSAAEAQTLLSQIQPQLATAIAAVTATGPITATTTLTSTSAPLATTPGLTATAPPQGSPVEPVGPVLGTITTLPVATPTK